MTLMIDTQRNIEDTRSNFIELNLATQTGFSSLPDDNSLYAASAENRNELINLNTTAVSAIFSVGKWTVLKSTDVSKAVVINSLESLNQTSIATFDNCSKISRTRCTSGGDDKIYCLEVNEAGTEHYLIYYSMPSCERLKFTARIVKTFPANSIQSISAQGQLLSVCSTSKTSLAAVCEIYDLNTSLFTLENPDQAKPMKTLQYSVSATITQVLSFQYIMEWGCAFYVATTTSSTNWNFFYKCMTDSLQGSILAADLATPASSIAYNQKGFTVAFKTAAAVLTQVQFIKNEDSALPNNCVKYNSEISVCYQCANFTTLLKEGGCSEPVKSFIQKSYFETSFSMHVLTFQFVNLNQDVRDLIWNNTKSLDFVYFSNPDVAAFYNLEKISSESELNDHLRIRVRLWPNQSVGDMETDIGMRVNGFASKTARLLQAAQNDPKPANFSHITIPAYYYSSPGQQASFQLLFDHMYALVFFVKVYLIIIRPLVSSWSKEHLHLWLTQYVMTMQTLFLFGLNSLSLKGMANEFFMRAGMASLRFLSWDPVPNAESSRSFEYFQGGLSIAGVQPAFLQEMITFFVLYILGFAGGILSPYFNEKFYALRTASLLCYLPQVWFMFFSGALNMLLGGYYSTLNYFSFGLSLIMMLIIIADILQLLLPSLRERLGGLFGNQNQGIIIYYDVLDYYTKVDQIPIWYHIEIFVAILTGIIIAVTFNSPTAQVVLLFVLYLLPIPVYYFQFRRTTNRRMTRFKFAASVVVAVFMLVAIILHTKQQGLDSIIVVSVIMMGLFLLAAFIYQGTFLLRIIDIICKPPGEIPTAQKDANQQGTIVLDGKRETSDGSVSALKYASILDRYLHPDQSRVALNDSKNDSEVHVRMLDNSVSRMK